MAKFCTHEEFLKKLEKTKPHIELLDTYVDYTTKLHFRCKIHGDVKYVSPRIMFKSKYGCRQCAIEAQREQTKLSNEEFLKRVNDTVEVLSEYDGWYGKVKCRCKICGYEWETGANSLIYNSACPKCKSSKGEQNIQRILEKAGIKYFYQHGFPDCRDKQKLLFDFYLPDFNTCIEFDGRQHFTSVGFGCKGKEQIQKKFKDTKRKDKIKNDYCKSKGINLIRISCFDEKSMENLIDLIFKKAG